MVVISQLLIANFHFRLMTNRANAPPRKILTIIFQTISQAEKFWVYSKKITDLIIFIMLITMIAMH